MKKMISMLTVAAMLFVLAVSVAGCSSSGGSRKKNKASYGDDIGDRCYGEDLQIISGGRITNETVDPTETGKITVINFWGTWCGPCLRELPHFDEVAQEYRKDVTIVAIHSSSNLQNAPAYIEENYADSRIVFAAQEGDDYYDKLGGEGYFPYTVIIDEDGIITDQFTGAIDYDTLVEAIENAK